MIVQITGNTYPVKEQLKRLGAHWNKDARAWEIDAAYAAQAQAIVNARPAPETRTCWECGRDFTYADCRKWDGDWSDSYCGC